MSVTPQTPLPSDERLESWKEIAAYLKKGVRTVPRWRRPDGLAVGRVGQDRTGVVVAYKAEIDAWWREQSRLESPLPPVAERPARRRPRWWIAATLVTAAAGIAAIVSIGRSPAPL